MASRALSSQCKNRLTKSFGLLNAVKKNGYATVAVPTSRVTTLDNGIRVASEHNSSAAATVGVWIDAGSKSESKSAQGTAKFVERLTFKGTKGRPQSALENEIEKIGGELHSYTTRDHTAYYANVLKGDVNSAVDILGDLVQNANITKAAVDSEREALIKARETRYKKPEAVALDHLYATAFQGDRLGRPVHASEASIRALKANDLISFVENNYTADRVIVSAAGDVNHDQLVQQVQKAFGGLKSHTSHKPFVPETPQFVGSEVRLRDDAAPEAHIALAVQGPGIAKRNDYATLQVMQAIVGSWDRALGSVTNGASKLAPTVHKHHLANSYMSFTEGHANTSLFGMYLISENVAQLDDLTWFAIKEWNRLSTAPTDGETFRAKNQVLAALHHSLNGNTATAEHIAKQLSATGAVLSPAELSAIVEGVTTSDVQRVAQEYLWDQEVAVVGVGPIEGMTDFTRVRGYMARSIW